MGGSVWGGRATPRRDCRLARIKGFDAPWATGHARLAALEPAGYTRIGPALRHYQESLRVPFAFQVVVEADDQVFGVVPHAIELAGFRGGKLKRSQ